MKAFLCIAMLYQFGVAIAMAEPVRLACQRTEIEGRSPRFKPMIHFYNFDPVANTVNGQKPGTERGITLNINDKTINLVSKFQAHDGEIDEFEYVIDLLSGKYTQIMRPLNYKGSVTIWRGNCERYKQSF